MSPIGRDMADSPVIVTVNARQIRSLMLDTRPDLPMSGRGIGRRSNRPGGIEFRALRDLIVERLPFHDEVAVDH
jgi:hypothetical protein